MPIFGAAKISTRVSREPEFSITSHILVGVPRETGFLIRIIPLGVYMILRLHAV
jgi:hypothetical protein